MVSEQIADALDCFWNAAVGAGHNAQDPTAMAVLGGISEGIAAVANRLREQALAQQGASVGQGATDEQGRPLTCWGGLAVGQGEAIGEMREGGVNWFGPNPHAFPVGTKYYTTPPTAQTLSDREREALEKIDHANAVYAATLVGGGSDFRKAVETLCALVRRDYGVK